MKFTRTDKNIKRNFRHKHASTHVSQTFHGRNFRVYFDHHPSYAVLENNLASNSIELRKTQWRRKFLYCGAY